MPDATMLADLAKANSQAEARRAGQPGPETMAKVTVRGRRRIWRRCCLSPLEVIA